MAGTDFERFTATLVTMGARHEIHTDASLSAATTLSADCITVRQMADALGFPPSVASISETAVTLGRGLFEWESLTFVFDSDGNHLAYVSGDVSGEIWSKEKIAGV